MQIHRVLTGRAVTLEITSVMGLWKDTWCNASAMASAAGCMRLQWKGADTGNSNDRPANPLVSRMDAAYSTPLTVPLRTSCNKQISVSLIHHKEPLPTWLLALMLDICTTSSSGTDRTIRGIKSKISCKWLPRIMSALIVVCLAGFMHADISFPLNFYWIMIASSCIIWILLLGYHETYRISQTRMARLVTSGVIQQRAMLR
jgi:hypothetical protein